MSLKHIRARVTGREDDRAVVLTKFPGAPLARIQVLPPHRDGVVLDIHELRVLADGLDEIIYEIEEAP